MTLLYKYCLLLFLLSAVLHSCKKENNNPESGNDFIVAGYLPAWGMDAVDFEVAGHLDILYFFSLAPDENGEFYAIPEISEYLTALKGTLHRDRTRLYIVVGGYWESETIFPMAKDAEKRASYIHELVSFCRENGLDGVDLDWEPYPFSISDEEYLALAGQMSDSLRANNLEFSIAMMISQYNTSAKLILLVDYINVMAYEIFDDEWNHIPMDMFEDYAGRHISAGIPAGKMIMGVPYFGRRQYREGDTSPTFLTYRRIVELASPAPGQDTYLSYAYNGIDLVRQKTRYLMNGNYAGIMSWEISQDAPYNSGYSLTRAIIEEVGK